MKVITSTGPGVRWERALRFRRHCSRSGDRGLSGELIASSTGSPPFGEVPSSPGPSPPFGELPSSPGPSPPFGEIPSSPGPSPPFGEVPSSPWPLCSPRFCLSVTKKKSDVD